LNCENNLILFLQNLKKTPARSTFKNIPTLEYVLSSPTEAVSGFGKKNNDNTTYQQQRHSDGQGNGWRQQKRRRG
jgi:hypothetical protein